MSAATMRVGRREIEVTHPDKALFAKPRTTKLDLARYYERVAPAMLPHVRDRPLALQVFPRGVGERGYFMKNVPGHFPDWIATDGGRQARRVAHPGARHRRGDARLPRRPERRHAARLALAGRRAVPARPPDHRLRPVAGRPLRDHPRRRARRRRPPARRRPRRRSRWSPARAASTSSARCAAGPPSRTCTPTRTRSPSRWSTTTRSTSRSNGTARSAASASSSTSTGSTTRSTRSRRTASGPASAPRSPCRSRGTSCPTRA